MKKILLFLFALNVLWNHSYSQKRNDIAGTVAGGIVGGIAGAIVAKSVIKSYEERFENAATEWVLSNDTITDFELKIIRFESVTNAQFQNISAVPFIVRTKNTDYSYVLIFVLSSGWRNEYGVNFTKIKPLKMNKDYWNNLMFEYLNLSGIFKIQDINNIKVYKRLPSNYRESDEEKTSGKLSYINKVSDNGQISLQRVKELDYKMSIENLSRIQDDNFVFQEEIEGSANMKRGLFPLNQERGEDMHLIKDLNNELKIDYNENNLNLFIKETNDLFQLKRKVIVELNRELYFK